MWYLNDTNTDVITIADVKPGDIITYGLDFDHGFKVHDVLGSVIPGRKEIRGSGLRWAVEPTRQVRRLQWDYENGTVKRAERFKRANGLFA